MSLLRHNLLRVLLVCGAMDALVLGQAGTVSIPAPGPELAFDNDYFRVLRVAVPAGEIPIHGEQSRDVVIVPIVPPAPGRDIGVIFVAKGSPPHVTPLADPYEALVIEVKKHWEAEVRSCASPMTCTHKITAGGLDVGETTLLFGNGFVTAYRHHLISGGTLDSSYHSTKGTNHILVVALTELPLNVGGIEQDLRSGQVFFSDQTEAEVNAGSHAADWVVLRVLSPR